MITTVLFDMGGTLEDIWYNEETESAVTTEIMNCLERHGLQPICERSFFREKLFSNMKRYKAWSEKAELEKKPEEIWTEYHLQGLVNNPEEAKGFTEELAKILEEVHFHRELRPGVAEALEELQARGFKLGIISNTASLYSVFDVLEKYGIRKYFRDVTLSSVTGYRKPHKSIFDISLRQMQSKPEECVYVGDTISRDIIGAKKAGFRTAIQIKSFLSKEKDSAVAPEWKPDFIVESIGDVLTCIETLNASA